MLIFDQLKKDDPQLRFMAVMVLAGVLILLCGLWWIQVVSVKYYQEKLEIQSIRTVRVPAVRGKILDREGRSLAENRPSYNIDLYLEDLSRNFQAVYRTNITRVKKGLAQQVKEQEKKLNRSLTAKEKKQFALPEKTITELMQRSRYEVSSNIVAELSVRLQHPIILERTNFQRRYERERALPLPILANLNSTNVARFEEQSMYTPGLDLDVQSLRYYPNNTVAAHLLGYLIKNNENTDDETENYNHRLIDYIGLAGIEGLFNKELHGTAGSKSVLVNNLGYRQNETVWSPSEPGQNVVLTIDLEIQKAAESALQAAMADTRGAVVVMDANNGDILAMASAPTYNPNHFIHRPEPTVWENAMTRWHDNEVLRTQSNHAMQMNYHPGSIFKIVVGLAALEQGVLNPNEIYMSDGYYLVGKHKMNDTAGAGPFDFNRALAKSSNPYFIVQGLKPGVLPKIIALGQRLHLGEKTGLIPGQEARGNFPVKDITYSSWRDGDTANLSIGQGKIDVTPLQMAVMTAAVANGGKVLYPRLVARLEPVDGIGEAKVFPEGRVRDNLGVSQRSLRIVQNAMLADVESAEGTGHAAAVPGWRIGGKTGTAQVEKNGHVDKSIQQTWFVSYAQVNPGELPRYVVVATVEGGASGGGTCSPIAHKVYLALQQREQQKKNAPKPGALAQIR
ncbi:MAG: Penicillin-binding protein 2 [Pedosphaera sp.]|nr:Penicillin-binding protein 2 [Pedosphaera sp.]